MKVNIPSDESVNREAQERAERAKRYAEMFPEQIRTGEQRFCDVEWQEDYLRRIYKLTPLERVVNNDGVKVNKEVDVNSRKEYMRRYMAKKRALKRGEKV